MSDTALTDPATGAGRVFFKLASGFWSGATASRAWFWTIIVFVCLAAQILSQVGMNFWNRIFFDALEKRDAADVVAAFLLLPALLALVAAAVSSLVVSRMMLQMRWREWVTRKVAGWWLSDQRYYRMQFTAPEQSAPEFRIADDVRLGVEPLVEFALGLTAAFVTAATFAAILWQVAGSYTVTLGGISFDIPAYMAVAAVIYAIIASTAAYLAGSPLINKVSNKNETEAQFRAEMTRLRENAESIALIRGDKDELATLMEAYDRVAKAWLSVIRQNGIVAIVLNTNGALFPILPLLLITPKYLAGDITLGGVMQVVAAFSAVQGALIWFVDNSMRLAEWYASARRVVELTTALQDIDVGMIMEDDTQIVVRQGDEVALVMEDLSVADSSGRTVISETSIRIEPGEKVMLTGESGAGKSILIRALAGLWPWGSGTITLPRGAAITFVPQRPYVPLGTLREAMVYPVGTEAVPDEVITAAMRRCGLGYLIKRLDEESRWDQSLSGGERQRLAFARLLIQRPSIIIMDEATSALDEDSQFSLLSLLHEDLAACTVISVAHRTGIEEFHTRKIHLAKRPAGASVTQTKLQSSLWRLLPGLAKA